jgi:hypothetical protein
MAVARRYDPGVLPSPATAGAVRVAVCRLSGLRVGAECPGTDEWFLPGTAPAGDCGWHGPAGRVAWPAEYAEWVAQGGAGEPARTLTLVAGPAGADSAVADRPLAEEAPGLGKAGPARAGADARFRIVSPLQGDRYQIPPDVDPRYATIALRAVGASDDGAVRWWVDGSRVVSGRWQLRRGAHAARAVAASGRSAEVTFEVK